MGDSVDGVEDLSSGEEDDYPSLIGRVTPLKIQAEHQFCIPSFASM